MSPSPEENKDEQQVKRVLGDWCYRDIVKEQVKIETARRRENPSPTAPGEGRQEATQTGDDISPSRMIPTAVESFQNILHCTKEELEERTRESIKLLDGRHPHRARLISDFKRPLYMANSFFMDCLWGHIRAAEKQLCEDHLGAKAVGELEGGYREAFKMLQTMHGVQFMDNLLREEVEARWIKVEQAHNGIAHTYLQSKQLFKRPEVVLEVRGTRPKPLGSRSVANPDDSRKKVKVSDLETNVQVPQRSTSSMKPTLTINILAPRLYRNSKLSQEVLLHSDR